MPKYIYEHLFDLQELEDLLLKVDMSVEERTYLVDAAKKTIHLELVKFILDELPEGQRADFLHHLEAKSDDKGIGIFLTRSINNLEDRLRALITQVRRDFIEAVDDYIKTSEEWFVGD